MSTKDKRGGRRASGGGLGSVSKTFAVSDRDGNEMGLIIEMNGEAFWQSARGDVNKLPDNVSAQDYADRVQMNGGVAKMLSKSDLDKRDAEHKAYRQEVEAFLDKHDLTNKTMKQGTKANRTAARMSRRRG